MIEKDVFPPRWGDIGPDRAGFYIRRSTSEQDDEHQRADIMAWLYEHDLVIGDVDLYVQNRVRFESDLRVFFEL